MPKINSEYDIGAAFEAIENELIASMIRNMRRHKIEEILYVPTLSVRTLPVTDILSVISFEQVSTAVTPSSTIPAIWESIRRIGRI